MYTNEFIVITIIHNVNQYGAQIGCFTLIEIIHIGASGKYRKWKYNLWLRVVVMALMIEYQTANISRNSQYNERLRLSVLYMNK